MAANDTYHMNSIRDNDDDTPPDQDQNRLKGQKDHCSFSCQVKQDERYGQGKEDGDCQESNADQARCQESGSYEDSQSARQEGGC